jgi:hypothetical protein
MIVLPGELLPNQSSQPRTKRPLRATMAEAMVAWVSVLVFWC